PNANLYSNPDGCVHSYVYGYLYSDSNPYSDSYSDCNTYSHSYSDSNADSDSYPHTNADGNGNAWFASRFLFGRGLARQWRLLSSVPQGQCVRLLQLPL